MLGKIKELERNLSRDLKMSSADLLVVHRFKASGFWAEPLSISGNFFTKSIMTWEINSGYGTSCARGDQEVVDGVCRRGKDGTRCALIEISGFRNSKPLSLGKRDRATMPRRAGCLNLGLGLLSFGHLGKDVFSSKRGDCVKEHSCHRGDSDMRGASGAP